jgi:hypothetical protein
MGLIVGLFLTFSVLSFNSLNETQDASVVQSVQTDLQGTIAQASNRLGVNGDALSAPNVINAIKTNLPLSAKLRATGLSDAPYELVFEESNRRVLFTVSMGGDVRIKGLLGNWTRFRQVNGIIQKN